MGKTAGGKKSKGDVSAGFFSEPKTMEKSKTKARAKKEKKAKKEAELPSFVKQQV